MLSSEFLWLIPTYINLFSLWWTKYYALSKTKIFKRLNVKKAVVYRVHWLPEVLLYWGVFFWRIFATKQAVVCHFLVSLSLYFNTLYCLSLFLQLRNQGQVRGTSAAGDEWRRLWPCLAVSTFPDVCLWLCAHRLGSQPRVCIYVCVCPSVAVYKMHVELQIKIHTLVYICTYKHTEGISTISPKYCTYLQQECKRKYFQYIYLEQILIIIRVIPLMDKLTAM